MGETEYITFMIELSEGKEVEMAVLMEFEYEKKYYVAAGLVEGDEIQEGVYIFKVKDSEEFAVEKLRNKYEYDKVTKAYLEMLDEEDSPED